jgi:hypothetical protein
MEDKGKREVFAEVFEREVLHLVYRLVQETQSAGRFGNSMVTI